VEQFYPLAIQYGFDGLDADRHRLDLYDLSRSLKGLSRSLSITTHFILNGEIITRTPALRNANIYISPPRAGSFFQDITVGVVAGAAFALFSSSNTSVIGHIIYSAYDYIIKTILGFHVNLEEPLYKTYLEHETLNEEIRASQLESIAEKCESSIEDMHRPIFASGSALEAKIIPITAGLQNKIISLDSNTYDNIRRINVTKETEMFTGRVSSFSANTQSGRIYTDEEMRSIPFEIDREADLDLSILSESLNSYTILQTRGLTKNRAGYFKFNAKRAYSINNTTRKYYITEIYETSLQGF